MLKPALIGLLLLTTSSLTAAAQDATQCVMRHYQNSDGKMTLNAIRAQCEQPTINEDETSLQRPPGGIVNTGVISERFLKEQRTQFDPYVITPHKMNYILPAYITNDSQNPAYEGINSFSNNLEDIESKFQLSLKVPLTSESMFIEGDSLYLGFTLQAWWQVYASSISKPFRETNYQPEVFYMAPLDWHPFGGNTGFVVGLEHQSNGRSQGLSRSWNRLYGHFLYEKDDFALSFKPWARLQEDEKEFPQDPEGDDNPDIEDYMGKYELGMMYKWDNLQFSFMGRRNFATKKGALELGVTFPLWGRLRGYAQAFNGYGDSMIDYNHKQTRFGIGFALSDML